MLTQYQANQRERHLERMHLIFHYLWKNTNKRMMLDPADVVIDAVFIDDADWREFYEDIIDEVLLNMP